MSRKCAIYAGGFRARKQYNGKLTTGPNDKKTPNSRCHISCDDAPSTVCGTYWFAFGNDGDKKVLKDWKMCISQDGRKKRDCTDTLNYDGPAVPSFKYPNGYPYKYVRTEKYDGKTQNKFDNTSADPYDPTISVTPIEWSKLENGKNL